MAKVAADPSAAGADSTVKDHQEGDATKNPVVAWENPAREKGDAPKQGLFDFRDRETIKKEVRASLLKPEPYSVFNFYKADTIWHKIATHSVFENTTLAVIAINAIYIAIDTDWNKDDPLTPTPTKSLTESGTFFQFMEHSFCVYFTFEICIRFLAFENKLNCRKDGWFVFDSLLVTMMVAETWVLLIIMKASGASSSGGGKTSILRLFRLLRLSRLMRMLRSLPELMILIKGMVTAMKSVVYVMCLLVILTYVFAIAFTQLAFGSESIGDMFFSNVSHSMYSLLIYATLLDDLSAFTDALREEMWPLLVLTLIFISLAALTVMNMLIGVLCEVVSAVADREREEILTVTVSERMQKIVGSLDTNKSQSISYEEFTQIIQMPEALRALEEVGVNPVGIVDFAELFFSDEDGCAIELTFDKFMEMVLDLRESNTATVKDVLKLWTQVKTSTNRDLQEVKRIADTLNKKVDEKTAMIESDCENIEGQVAAVLSEVRKLTGKIEA